MKKLIGLCFVLAACASDQAPSQHDVEWVPREGITINMDACIGIRVTTSTEGGRIERAAHPCDATTAVVTSDPDDPVLEIDVDYQYFMIPFGCESQSCWVESTMATGSAEFDATAERTTIVVDTVTNLPF